MISLQDALVLGGGALALWALYEGWLDIKCLEARTCDLITPKDSVCAHKFLEARYLAAKDMSIKRRAEIDLKDKRIAELSSGLDEAQAELITLRNQGE